MKTSSSTKHSAVLLASASSGGTIAAVRNLGALEIDVRVLSSEYLSAAAWSRYATRSYFAPAESDQNRFLTRLVAIGAADPGQVLLPTSDQTAWLYTEHADLLSRYFRVYQPSIECIRRILDKKLFASAAAVVGLAALPSWDPRNIDELASLAPSLPYPILIKPRTHVHRLRNSKGIVVHTPTDLIYRYQQFVSIEQARPTHSSLMPDAELPILQQFVSVANEGVHSVTGFIDRTGELFVTRRSRKVLQRSRPVGVGICFESLPPSSVLSNSVRKLCRELGYFGIFEVEFLWWQDRWNVIDFNPRLFNQVGMEVRRGMPLPFLAYLDASGETARLRDVVANAQREDEGTMAVLYDHFTLRALIFAQTLTLRMSREDRANWRTWIKKNCGHSVDFAADSDDPKPGYVHALSEIYLGLKAFPRFLRSTPRASKATETSAIKMLP
jgi:D-aspartate ligase